MSSKLLPFFGQLYESSEGPFSIVITNEITIVITNETKIVIANET